MTVKSETLRPQPTSTPGIVPASTARWYMSPAIIMATTTVAVLADRVYYQPMLYGGMAIDRIGIEVTSGSAGLCRLGIYSNASGAPGSLIIDAGTVDTTSIATVEATIAELYLPNDWVWVCALFNATPTCRIGAVGDPSMLGVGAFGTGQRGVLNTFAFAALPPTPTTGIITGANVPMIGVRKSA